MNDPRFRGMMKAQKQREAFLKNTELQDELGIHPRGHEGVILHLQSTEQIVDPVLPLKYPLFSWVNCKFQVYRVFNKFLSWVFHPWRLATWYAVHLLHLRFLPLLLRLILLSGYAATNTPKSHAN